MLMNFCLTFFLVYDMYFIYKLNIHVYMSISCIIQKYAHKYEMKNCTLRKIIILINDLSYTPIKKCTFPVLVYGYIYNAFHNKCRNVN